MNQGSRIISSPEGFQPALAALPITETDSDRRHFYTATRVRSILDFRFASPSAAPITAP